MRRRCGCAILSRFAHYVRRAVISEAQILTPEELAPLLEHPSPALRLVQVTDAALFEQYHLPHAQHVAPAELVAGTPPAPGKLPELARLEALFSRLGYDADCEFVVYDDEGGGWAGRFAWTLDMVGHRRWRYLDGGLHAWAAADGELASGPAEAIDASAVSLELDERARASLDEVRAAIDDPAQLIWDVRSREEYLGLRSGSARAGHIPGAVNVDWLLLKEPERHQRLREDLEAFLEAHGVDGGRRVITHCQTHHRSGLSYMVGRLLGFADVRAYDGSWAEWGNRDDTPVVT